MRWTAALIIPTGLVVALLSGAWEVGAIISSSGVVLLGVVSLAKDGAVAMMLIVVGTAGVIGVLGHLLTGVGP